MPHVRRSNSRFPPKSFRICRSLRHCCSFRIRRFAQIRRSLPETGLASHGCGDLGCQATIPFSWSAPAIRKRRSFSNSSSAPNSIGVDAGSAPISSCCAPACPATRSPCAIESPTCSGTLMLTPCWVAKVVFIFSFADQIGEDESRLLEAVAAVVLDEARGPLARQLAGMSESPGVRCRASSRPAPRCEKSKRRRCRDQRVCASITATAGFRRMARNMSSILRLGAARLLPGPTSSPMTSSARIVTEAGCGFTWAVNSGENRLTPWTNDPVADLPVEALYLRDEESAEFWTPTPRACRSRRCMPDPSWRWLHDVAQSIPWHGAGAAGLRPT